MTIFWNVVMAVVAVMNVPTVLQGFEDGHTSLILSAIVLAVNVTYLSMSWGMVAPVLRGWRATLDAWKMSENRK